MNNKNLRKLTVLKYVNSLQEIVAEAFMETHPDIFVDEKLNKQYNQEFDELWKTFDKKIKTLEGKIPEI